MPASSTPPDGLSCDIRTDGRRTIVAPRGEIDLATAPALDERLAEVIDAGATEVLVDLHRVTFLDSSGLRSLIVWSEASRRDGFALQISVDRDSMPWRVLELTGVLPMLPIVDGGAPPG